MSQTEESKHFNCPKCGNTGNIFFIKAVGKKIIIKQKCPQHGDRSFNIPLMKKNLFIPHFRDGVFKCSKCGKETTVESAKPSGPWMLIKCVCPTHGKNLPPQRIWSTIYTDIYKEEVSTQQPDQPSPVIIDEKKFCPNCGTILKESGKFCDACGTKIV
ncbi:MAG: hypothetical protein ACFFA0_07975 [Promethearchaeota archaeon]